MAGAPREGLMAIDKVAASLQEAVGDIPNGATVMIGGFGGPGGMPQQLILALRDHGAMGLTIVTNSAGLPGFGAKKGSPAPINTGALFANHQVKKVIASFPVPRSVSVISDFQRAWQAGEVELEVVPQGTLAERIRAGGAGIPAFYTPTGVGTLLSDGKEVREFEGRAYVLERALKADFALISAATGDRMGNLAYRGSSQNFNPVMAMAATVTIAQVDVLRQPGELEPESIVTPGVFVQRVVERPREAAP